uniref:Uncharacterized protein n=1 Tax=Oryzias sinensis TaxID=183150 RepID=A0A8C7X515_9TELE
MQALSRNLTPKRRRRMCQSKKSLISRFAKFVFSGKLTTRYGQQMELKEQNHHLTAANEELQKNLAEAQHRVAELELQFGELQRENSEVQKNLQNCHVLLVSAKIDPGKSVFAIVLTVNLLRELKSFGNAAAHQRAQLQVTDPTDLFLQEHLFISLCHSHMRL